MNKNTSIVLVATVVGIMLAGALALTLSTSQVYANEVEHAGGHNHQSADGGNGVNTGGGSDNAHGGNPNANGGNSYEHGNAEGGNPNANGGNGPSGGAAACHNRCGANA